MKRETLRHEFVEFIPSVQEEGVLYVSVAYATAVHRCFCGCGEKVVTPLGPTDWTLIFNGRTVSLTPSVGNWSYDCQSHYWIKRNRVIWAAGMSPERIAAGREADRLAKQLKFGEVPEEVTVDEPARVHRRGWVTRAIKPARVWLMGRTRGAANGSRR